MSAILNLLASSGEDEERRRHKLEQRLLLLPAAGWWISWLSAADSPGYGLCLQNGTPAAGYESRSAPIPKNISIYFFAFDKPKKTLYPSKCRVSKHHFCRTDSKITCTCRWFEKRGLNRPPYTKRNLRCSNLWGSDLSNSGTGDMR